MMGVQALDVQRMGVVYHKALRTVAFPVAHGQLGMVALLSDTSHEDGVGFSAQLMTEHLRKAIRNLHGLEIVVDETVGCLCPFQDDIGSLLTMVGKETAVQRLTFGFEHTHRHVDAGLLQLPDATSLHLGEGIDTTHHHALYTFLHDQVGTRGRLTIVRAGFERHVKGSLLQQRLVLLAYRGKGVHFGMSHATSHVVALADDSSIAAHNHCAHHWVGFGVLPSVPGQLKTPSHIFLVSRHRYDSIMRFHFAKIRISPHSLMTP